MAAPWATTADVTAWLLGGPYTAPTGADATRVLARAWEVVEDHTDPAYDSTEVLDTTTGRTVADALTDAVCAQVEQWAEVGEDNDIAGFPRNTSSSWGVSVSALPDVLAPRAARILRRAAVYVTKPRPAPISVELI